MDSHVQTVIDHFGVTVAAITGVLAARGKQVDLFGVVVLALVTAFGGGTIRDLTLAAGPVFWTKDSGFFLNAAITAVLTFYVVRYRALPMNALLIADAFVLAAFTMAGTRKALELDFAPSIAVAMGVITGVAGGVLRDVLTGEMPVVFRRETCLYATAAFLGAAVFVVLTVWAPATPRNAILGILTTLGLRLAGIRWHITLPVFQPKSGPSENGPDQPGG